MADAKLGEKRICPNCGTKFYDLNKKPITCPKCAESFVPAPPVSAVASKRKAAAKPEKKVKAPVRVLDAEEDADDLAAFDPADKAALPEELEEIDDTEENIESISELEGREVAEDRVNSDDVDDEVLIDEMEGGKGSLVDQIEDDEEEEKE